MSASVWPWTKITETAAYLNAALVCASVAMANDGRGCEWLTGQLTLASGQWNQLTLASGQWNQLTLASGQWNQLTLAGGQWNQLTLAGGQWNQLTLASGQWNQLTLLLVVSGTR